MARLERWPTARLAAGIMPATVNRDIASLRSVLSRAVEWGVLSAHPLAKLKAAQVDVLGVVRFLAPDEERRLREALTDRDERRREARARANAWRRERGYPECGAFGAYTDHLTPLVLTALNTGLRRGELLTLRWEDVDLGRALVTVRAGNAKGARTRHVPLNVEVARLLTAWRGPDEDRRGYVFLGRDGEPLDGAKTAWGSLVKAAKIDRFRFHDLRHTFASKLVMARVDLNTVRELLGLALIRSRGRFSYAA